MRNQRATQLLFELSHPGRGGAVLPACDVPQQPIAELIPDKHRASARPPLPELAEPEVVRHYANLSTLNMSVDTHFYPLGSCTMKYNSKRNERVAGLPGIVDLHPYQPESTLQGLLHLLYELQCYLAEIAGLPCVSLQPAAGAHGELTALMVAAAYFRHQGRPRHKVLAPDSAHGTNPASAAMAGFEFVTVRSNPQGFVDLEDLDAKLDDDVAVFMITNPSTLGLFERGMRSIAERVHAKAGLIYLDGANMNAILGICRPGDFGADMMHFNPHKTFSGPHGGGGPGAGPIAVAERLGPFLPTPVVERVEVGVPGASPAPPQQSVWGGASLAPGTRALAADTQTNTCYRYRLAYDRPESIGRVRSFFGNTGVLVRAYAYIRTHGPEGLRRVAENAVLNANYLLSQIKDVLPVPQGNRCTHEFVASAARLKAERGISAMDIAKRLLDYGFHAPTVYFPLTVKEAVMIEPTETESKETLDAFAAALRTIVQEPAELLHEAPHTTIISRPDEVTAARKAVLRWKD
ncbi:MAG: aminomethyl-transferring glycine dehydrogenase subunit GcvPB [Planctomycetes bacterium]|nr:aminomethyl-transferring glycine dehydrogenase subunit GcvPB [Planctomycetota bacterium]